MEPQDSKVRAIDGIVFHAEYDPDASLVKRVTPLPDSASHVGLVTVMEPNRPIDLERPVPARVCDMDDDEQPVDIDELLPIRVSDHIETEFDDLGAVVWA